ncbi:MAG: hypothetical protein RL662_949 [Bacteroidota bacterium]|jgi:fucose 4-O-acetylase-like acetyltransferase
MNGNKHFDSIKLFLIFWVVFAHVIRLSSDFSLFLSLFVSTFVMPMFIMISGYQAKKINWVKYKRTTLSLLLTYAVFQIVYSFPSFINHLMGAGDFSYIDFFFVPVSVLWFVWGLIIWRTLIFLIVKYKVPTVYSMSVALIVSLALGFSDTVIPNSRIFVFFPLFYLGYLCPKSVLDKVQHLSKTISIAILSIVALLTIYLLSKDLYQQSSNTIFGESPFSWYPSVYVGIVARLSFYLIALACSAAIFSLWPDTYHKYGSKSFQILILHPIFVYPIYHAIVSYNQWQVPFVLEMAIAMAIVGLCIMLSRFKLTTYLINPMAYFKYGVRS